MLESRLLCFNSNSMPLTDYNVATAFIETTGRWCPAWEAHAEEHEARGMAALEAGTTISAGEHL